MNIFLFLFILICVITLIYFLFTLNRPKTLSSTIERIYKTINDSYYFDKMTELDLKAREAISNEAYKELYKKAVISFTPSENKELLNLTSKADALLEEFPRLYNIPWRFAKLDGLVENGFPHTIGDTIFLAVIPSVQTLIHEKIHVYQRMYPLETSILITDIWGFKIKDKQEHIKGIRNNPDLNSFVYGIGDSYIAQLYNSDNPRDLSDSTSYIIKGDSKTKITASDIRFPMSIMQCEHPNELMACLIPQIILGIVSQDKPKLVYQTKQWMTMYL